MSPRSTVGRLAGVLVAILFALTSQAQARDSAKFKVLSVSGRTTSALDVVYDPSLFGSCSFTQTERVSFHSTKSTTGYVFTSKAHGSARVAWSPKPEFSGNFTEVEVAGEVTVSRSATYRQTNYVDPETGETFYGCRHEVSLDGSPAADCAVEKTLPATLSIGGTSGTDESTYVTWSANQGDLEALDHACEAGFSQGGDDPNLFSRADLFRKSKKRLSDTDRVEVPAFDNATDDQTVTGNLVQELSGELKRKKPPT